MKSYIYKGVSYKSEVSLCDALKLNKLTLRRRLAKGMSLEDAIEKPKRHSYACDDHLGNKYSSIRKMAHKYKIRPCTLIYRLNHGYSLKDALTETRIKHSGFINEN